MFPLLKHASANSLVNLITSSGPAQTRVFAKCGFTYTFPSKCLENFRATWVPLLPLTGSGDLGKHSFLFCCISCALWRVFSLHFGFSGQCILFFLLRSSRFACVLGGYVAKSTCFFASGEPRGTNMSEQQQVTRHIDNIDIWMNEWTFGSMFLTPLVILHVLLEVICKTSCVFSLG